MSKPDYLSRFEEKFIPEPNSGCWLWTASQSGHGYGYFFMDGRGTRAHRAAWILYQGEIPNDLCVLHKCDNPQCVNPDHLWLGSHAENMIDRGKKARSARGVRVNTTKLSIDDVKKVRALLKKGINCTAIARSFGVSTTAIHAIRNRRTWAWIEEVVSDA